jgi:hypothetical protein
MAIDKKFVIRAADDFTWADEMVHDQVKEITNEEGEIIGGYYNLQTESQGTTTPHTREGNETTTAATKRAGDGDPRHDNRDATTTKTQEQDMHKTRNKKRKKITKTNHTTEWIQERLAMITQLDGTGGHEPLSKMA